MTPVTTIQRIMSISHDEFLRNLKPLGKHYPYRIDRRGRRIHLSIEDRTIEIRLGTEGYRRLGALELPETAVEFHFHNFEVQEIERFFFRFDLCFRRGGG
ncbi:MAG: hypothetical protein PVI92_11295 [Chromatiales bacterium]|jgi:hypothetical protein